MVHGSVALNPEREATTVFRIPDGEVDAVAGGTHLGGNIVATAAQDGQDGFLERALRHSASVEAISHH